MDWKYDITTFYRVSWDNILRPGKEGMGALSIFSDIMKITQGHICAGYIAT